MNENTVYIALIIAAAVVIVVIALRDKLKKMFVRTKGFSAHVEADGSSGPSGSVVPPTPKTDKNKFFGVKNEATATGRSASASRNWFFGKGNKAQAKIVDTKPEKKTRK